MTTGLRRLIRELVAAGDMTINTARQMLAEKPQPEDPSGAGWARIINDIRFEQELRRNGVQKAERAVINAALAWTQASEIDEGSKALAVLQLQCRWLNAEREKLDAEVDRIDAQIERMGG